MPLRRRTAQSNKPSRPPTSFVPSRILARPVLASLLPYRALSKITWSAEGFTPSPLRTSPWVLVEPCTLEIACRCFAVIKGGICKRVSSRRYYVLRSSLCNGHAKGVVPYGMVLSELVSGYYMHILRE